MNKFIKYGILILLIPIFAVLAIILWKGEKYNIISIFFAALACLPFLLAFERKKVGAKEIVLISALIAISVAGRFLFSPLPFFKPVAAIVIISGIYMGPQTGFLVGSMSAILSNIIFSQGPWTPFQMFSWGIIGFFAGILANFEFMKNKLFLSIYGFISGFIFSFIMDIWTVLSLQNGFNFSLYLAKIISAFPITLIYAISNVIFIWILSPVFGKKLERIKIKYGIIKPTLSE